MGSYVTIARILKVRGIRGEVAAEILTDFPERFQLVDRVRIESTHGVIEERLERAWFHKDRVILKFVGRNLPEQAAELVGGRVQIPEAERVELPPGRYYDSDLVGCEIVESGERIGVVRSVFEQAAEHSLLGVEADQGNEVLIPFVRDFILDVDVARKRIFVKLPTGLLGLSEPSHP